MYTRSKSGSGYSLFWSSERSNERAFLSLPSAVIPPPAAAEVVAAAEEPAEAETG
jgi:hypothetical protein